MKVRFDLNWKTAGLGALVGVVGALAVGWSGLVSIAASSGHFGPVSWFLHWTMQNAVDTQSLGLDVPADVDLSDPALVQRAAGHFASGCAACHGAPGETQSPVVHAMMPPPPRLEDRVGYGAKWKDRELFWIVQHGVKYSGMPAWVSQGRPDEVWAMVAFLRAYPGLTPERYGALALGDGEPAPTVGTGPNAEKVATALADCARCHGLDGQGVGGPAEAGAFPVIAGQPEPYLLETLRAYASGGRESGIMQPAAGIHSDEVLAALAAHYAAQPALVRPAAASPGTAPGLPETPVVTAAEPGPTGSPAAIATRDAVAANVEPSAAHGPPYDAAGLLELGRVLATEGLPVRKLPACESCHGDEGRARNPNYPRLAGQPAWYLSTHLQLWKHRQRGGGPYAHLMAKIAPHFTDEQIEALAMWYAGQGGG
ncbi:MULTISPECIES: c-type cytochrome [unclassified Aureimonas]|uniref:c-type cytochrome n=1 Tax=unclassified Aureimonas TaxID=2615206 RepID=UPI0006F76D6F|nr:MULTISPECIES: c-type cytochrome [unclassified Aureimonas]KQT65762.1 hypothetical protein ASG62_21565 [Aureimonas sp. Leaf427]KQT74762.1 hypothetical protein ASG54_16625 [Aureimonas sp. Leaf460]